EAAYPQSLGLFIYRGETKGSDPPARGLVGAWAASGYTAVRMCAMIVFGSYDYNQVAATGAALPIALWPLLTSAYELATSGRMMAVDAFLERVSHMSSPTLDDPEGASAGYRGWLATQQMKALWETGFGSEQLRFWVL